MTTLGTGIVVMLSVSIAAVGAALSGLLITRAVSEYQDGVYRRNIFYGRNRTYMIPLPKEENAESGVAE